VVYTNLYSDAKSESNEKQEQVLKKQQPKNKQPEEEPEDDDDDDISGGMERAQGSGLRSGSGGNGVIPFFLSFSYLSFVNGDEG